MPGELLESRLSPQPARTSKTTPSENELKPVLDYDRSEQGKKQRYRCSLCKNTSREDVRRALIVVCLLCVLETLASSTDSMMETFFPIEVYSCNTMNCY